MTTRDEIDHVLRKINQEYGVSLYASQMASADIFLEGAANEPAQDRAWKVR